MRPRSIEEIRIDLLPLTAFWTIFDFGWCQLDAVANPYIPNHMVP